MVNKMVIKFTKNIVFCFVLLTFSIGRAQFNTVKNTEKKGTVSFLDTLKIKEIDSINMSEIDTNLKSYNMGTLPLDDIVVTSYYGKRKHPIDGKIKNHYGVDLRAKQKLVYAVQAGIITDIGYDSKLGEFIKLKCGTFEFIYGHLNHVYVRLGSYVKMGDILGKTGSTGNVTAAHLHFAIKKDNRFINPLPILNIIDENLKSDLASSSND